MTLADLLPVANHLWQSTLFAAVAWLLAFWLRGNRAEIRYGLWLAASMKFLIPFAALFAIGGQFEWQSSSRIVRPEFGFVIDAIGQPFSRPELTTVSSPLTTSVGFTALLPILLLAVWFCGCAMHLLAWRVRWRRVAVIIREGSPVERGRELDIIRRLESILGTRQPIAVVSSETTLEPGVFGILKPVLLWPRSIGRRLADGQVEAILTHELCHVRRRDNLAAAVHMVVEALFWFHPLVWWLEKRLVDERERACDEEVIRLGSDPQLYAESILKTCELYAESPLACLSGVTGSNLRKRVEAIMGGNTGLELKPWKRIVLATAGVLTVGAPVFMGALNARPLQAQSGATEASGATFEVASVKPNKSDDVRIMELGILPGGTFTARNVPLKQLILLAYDVRDIQLSGGPRWIDAERFDIVARADGALKPGSAPPQLRQLLVDRFNLKVHTENREMPIYALVLARSDGKLGPAIRSSEIDYCAEAAARARSGQPAPPPQPGQRIRCGMRGGPGTLTAGSIPVSTLAGRLVGLVDRFVVDRTGLEGVFDFDLSWTPDQAAPADSSGPSIFTALQEQLGLKLESTRGPVDLLVIDSVEQQTPD